MNLSNVAKGTWAVKAVPLRLANAQAPLPGEPQSGAPAVIKVGVRVLLGQETAEVLEKAQVLAREKGVKEWKLDHPICTLYEMACTVARACCDVDQVTGASILGPDGKPAPFFDLGVEQALSDVSIGTDNLAYLHDQWVRWQDEVSLRGKTLRKDGTVTPLTIHEAIGAVMVDMEAPNSPDSPLLSMGHASLVTCIRIMASLLWSSPTDKSPSGLPGESSTTQISRNLLEKGLEAST